MNLHGKRILVTRSAEQAPALCEALAALGAEPVAVPMIAIAPPASLADLDRAIAGLADMDLLILTSVNAVEAFCGRLHDLGLDLQALAGLQVVAVGPKSAQALAVRGRPADLVPEDYRAEGVVNLLRDTVHGRRILYPKAALARELIPEQLRAAGAVVIDPVAYTSSAPLQAAEALHRAMDKGLDLLTFTASSTLENFVRLLDDDGLERARTIPVASIGPLTTTTARKHGFDVVVEPDKSTLDDMVEAIQCYFSGTRDAGRNQSV